MKKLFKHTVAARTGAKSICELWGSVGTKQVLDVPTQADVGWRLNLLSQLFFT